MAAGPARLTWQRTTVQGRPAVYGVAGEGRPLVFLHGWGLSHRSYGRALGQLVERGGGSMHPPCPSAARRASQKRTWACPLRLGP